MTYRNWLKRDIYGYIYIYIYIYIYAHNKNEGKIKEKKVSTFSKVAELKWLVYDCCCFLGTSGVGVAGCRLVVGGW